MNAKNLSFLTILALVIVGIFYLFTASKEPQINYNPQQIKLYRIDGSNQNPLNILATTLPQFALSLKDQKFKNLWEAHAQERKSYVESAVENAKGDVDLKVDAKFDETQKELVVTPQTENKLKPGLYKLNVKVKTLKGEDITITQDFTWGVLALNTNKGIYKVGEDVKIGMAVLDDFGSTKCIAKEHKVVYGTAKIWLTIKSPTGKTEELSTEDGSIKGSKSCADRSITNDGDFLTQLKAEEEGKYEVHMEAENLFGKRSMDYHFTVQNNVAFDIERDKYPTRIYPRVNYPVEITVKANQDYSGKVTDIVPASFKILDISGKGEAKDKKDFQLIQWDVNWMKGQTYTLSYTIDFPDIAPEFYLIGPLHIGGFSEGRSWQIASDGLFSLIQEANNFAASGTSITATLSQGVALNNLVVMNCYKVTNSSSTTTWPTISGWSRSYRSGASGARYAQYYRVVDSAYAGTTNVICTTGASSTGEFATEVMEFSGNATSSVRDKSVTRTSTVNCTTSANITSSMTPTNPDELIVTQFLSTTNGLTANSHTALGGASSGFSDNDLNGGLDGFSGGDSSYDSSWAEAINNPAINTRDTVIFSGGGNTCYNAATAYNATISITQGSFQFFDNPNSVNPSTTFNGGATAENGNIILTRPNTPFRLRILLDIDSASGTTLGLGGADFILQYAVKPSGGCATIATTVWQPITTAVATESATPIAFFPNTSTHGSGFNIASSGLDPSDTGYTTTYESYYEDDTTAPGPADGNSPGDITNDQAILSNNLAGLWDFSLVDASDGSDGRTYCLEIANSGGSQLSGYSNDSVNDYPEVTLYHAEVVIDGGTTIIGGTTIK